MEQLQKLVYETTCTGKDLQAVKDALYLLQGKWKLPILISILAGNHRFKEIARNVEAISDRMLSKELKELELNFLVTRKLSDTYSPSVEYLPTAHTFTLAPLVNALKDWGYIHRKKVIDNIKG
ncbi:winged helix-turn-helix transcriptional regulator [Pedobacter sp. AW31-3R]|uniref:winged helix-turn-helix transcriptional regulator n=1 Tax=Pedobacter sp. AW31-3R TaxID=3445781 RepID=UPI003FA06B7C